MPLVVVVVNVPWKRKTRSGAGRRCRRVGDVRRRRKTWFLPYDDVVAVVDDCYYCDYQIAVRVFPIILPVQTLD